MLLRTLVALLSFCCLLSAQDESKLLPPFQKAFRHGKREKPASVADRATSLGTLAGLDSSKTAEAIVEAWRNVDAELVEPTATDPPRRESPASQPSAAEPARPAPSPGDLR